MCNFTYEYFKKLLQIIKVNFKVVLFSDIPIILNTKEHLLVLRHDVDVSLEKALKMAKIEKKLGIHSTYMLLVNSPLYCIQDNNSKDTIKRIVSLGHEIGLHFDPGENDRSGLCDIKSIEAKILSLRNQLKKVTNTPISSISFHRPTEQVLRGPRTICRMVNAYSRELMESYLSDSRGRWRMGNPLPKLQKPEKPLLQLLIHPIWWGKRYMQPKDRLQEFFEVNTRYKSAEDIRTFDSALLKTLPSIQRRNLKDLKGKKGGFAMIL